jgi:iron complex outermembrane recepter protein
VNPEIPTAYEIGYKTSLADRKVTLSVAVFHTDFRDFQAQVVDQLPGAAIGSFRITNAGKLRTRGFEFEISARPLPELTLDAGLAFNDAKFVEFIGASCPRLGVLVTTVGAACGPLVAGGPNSNRFDASGQAAPNAPRWTANFGFRYELPLGTVRPYIQSNTYWRSATTFGIYPSNIPNPTTQPAYAVVNGAVGVASADGRWQAAVFVRNLFDQNYVTSIFDLPFDSAGGFGQFVTRDAQRTVGVQANVRF